MLEQESLEELAHELYTAAQLTPGEGIEDAVGRLVALMDTQQPSPTPQADSQPAPVRDYPPLPDFATVEQHIYGACRRYITQDMLEPIHNLIRDVIDADRASRATADSVPEDAERLKEAAGLLEELAEHGSYSIEYDGRMIPICPECGEQEGGHRPDCAFARAKAFLAARKRGSAMTESIKLNKIRTSELTGAALDWAVAKCEGITNLGVLS